MRNTTTQAPMIALEGFATYPPEVIDYYRAQGYWEDHSLAMFFDDICTKFADRVALVTEVEVITYRQLAQRAERLALHLLRLGVRSRDRIIMQLPNSAEFVYLYIALQKVGAIPIMALPSHREAEIEQFVRLSGAIGYIMPERIKDCVFAQIAEHIQQRYEHLRLILVAGKATLPGSLSLTDLLQRESGLSPSLLEEVAINPLDPAIFLLSGGTTGIPKLIPRTHNDYIYNSKTLAALNDIRLDDKLLVVLPMAHNFPLACPGIQGFLMHGASCIISASNHAKTILACMHKHKITHAELVPTLLIRLISDPELHLYDLSSLRIINAGGQKAQPELKRHIEGLLPTCKVQEIFGMAEGLLCCVRLDDTDEHRYETVGRPISPDDEIKLVDVENNEVSPGEVGELLVRGPYTLRGYYHAMEHNLRNFTPDGFYRTGDLMRQHSSGNYVIEGRKKDLINRGGEKISAEEIENLLLAHPLIVNAACVPMVDPTLGERICAFVILITGVHSLALTGLNEFLLGKGIAKFKLPERLEIVKDFPLSKFGKVSKKDIIAGLQVTLQNELASKVQTCDYIA